MGVPNSVNIGLEKNTPQNNRCKVNKKIPRVSAINLAKCFGWVIGAHRPCHLYVKETTDEHHARRLRREERM